jgi:predicted phosphoribosyltransferase
MKTFRNRTEAGMRLSQQMGHLREARPAVLALPRGGVVVGYEVAMALDAPLDVVVCRKLGAPGHEEFGFGAVGPDGVEFLDPDTVTKLGLPSSQISAIAAAESEKARQAEQLYRSGGARLDVRGRTVILVDDGIATGVTARAAIRWISTSGPRHVVLAVPVAPADTLRTLATEVDELICLKIPRDFQAVGQWYEDFSQVSDEEVIRLLRLARRNETQAGERPYGRPGKAQGSADVTIKDSLGGRRADETSGLPPSSTQEEVAKHEPRNH